MWQQLRGHQQQLEMFRRAIQRGRTSHAYLLVGPSGIGKRLFARMLTQALFCTTHSDDEFEACGECSACRQVLAGTHPDLLTVGCPEGKDILPISLIVGEDENRGREGLCHDISMRPMSANRRIAIVDDAEKMNTESANAFLKTLEEPPPGAMIFMIATEIDLILPTIRSRCQPVRFSPLTDEDLAELLVEAKDVETIEEALKIVPFAEGSLTTARQFLDPSLLQLRSVVEQTFSVLPTNPLQASKMLDAVFDEIGGDASRQRQTMRWANRFFIDGMRKRLRAGPDPMSADRLGKMIDRCIEAESHLNQTMPVPLCRAALLDDLGRLARTPVPV